MVKISLSTLMVCSALVAAPLIANASNEQRFPGVIDKELPKLEVPPSHSLEKKQSNPLEPAPQAARTGSQKVVANLKKITFKGNTVVSDDALQRVASDYLNRPLTEDDLAEFKYKVTKLFYDKGYILVKAVTPPQNLQDGAMEVTIYEARIGEVKVLNDGVVNQNVVNGFTRRLKGNSVFEEKKTETAIRDLNDLKGITAAVNLQPGTKVSTTDLTVSLEETPEDVQSVSVDNYGSELTGPIVGTLHLEKSNALRQGETVQADIRKSDGELHSIDTRATVPTGLYNTKLEGGFLYSANEIGDRLSALDARGRTQSVTLGLSSDVLNTRTSKASLKGGLEVRNHRSFRSDALETEDSIRQGFVDASYLWRQNNLLVYGSSHVSRGLGILDATSEGDPLATRALGDPEAWILAPLLIVQYHPTDEGSLKLVSTAQVSSNTLLSSDLFVLGGYGSVRGFEPAEETGEMGYQFSLEYDQNINISPEWSVKAGPFLDGGAVNNRLSGQTLDNHLYSAGLGLEFVTQLYPDAEPTSFRFDWAHPIGDYTSTNVDDDTVYFRVNQSF